MGQELPDARDADAVAVLAPAQPADRPAAVAQLVGLVVRVERERHGAAGAVGPVRRTHGAAGAHVVDDLPPLLLGPLPGPDRRRFVRHLVLQGLSRGRRALHSSPAPRSRCTPSRPSARVPPSPRTPDTPIAL